MKNKDFSISIEVPHSTSEVATSITNFRGWWSKSINGNTNVLNESFIYNYKDVHVCKMKLIELNPDKRITYKVLENHFSFVKDQSEWVDTLLIFDIKRKGRSTQITFTHKGLTPKYECFPVCEDAWNTYIKESLFNFITKGKGNPNPKTKEGINNKIAKKWKIDTHKTIHDFSYEFKSKKPSTEIYNFLLNPKNWWVGLYGEKITGSSKKLNYEFIFKAGDGMHYSKQRLIEAISGKKIVWQVTESKLTFLKIQNEWDKTKICFEIFPKGNKSLVKFTHIGLSGKLECYNGCSNAWGAYLKQLNIGLLE